jgi:hypothetical protein
MGGSMSEINDGGEMDSPCQPNGVVGKWEAAK